MKWHRILANGLTVAGIGIACFGLLGGVSTTEAYRPTDKVTICHRTASQTNPYVVLTVDENSVDGVAGNSGGVADHYGEHVGPIGPIPVGEWGDIIPPVVPYHTGLNWPAGEAIWENDCNIPTPTTETPTTETPTTEEGATTTEAPTTTTIPSTSVPVPTTAPSTSSSVEAGGPVTTLAPTVTTLVADESGSLPSTGQGSTMLMVGGLLMALTGLTLRGLARRTA